MVAIFGKDYSPERGYALRELPEPGEKGKLYRYALQAQSHTVLENGDTVLVANAEHVDSNDEPSSAHVASGLLNVYILRETDEVFKLVRRHENVASMGSSGQIGTVIWTKLAGGKPGLGILHGGSWNGYTHRALMLFDLESEKLLNLGSLSIRSDNDNACAPDSKHCWNIHGAWRFAPPGKAGNYDDLLIDFTGDDSTAGPQKDEEAGERVRTKVKVTARYAHDGKQYQLVEGSNPVPDI